MKKLYCNGLTVTVAQSQGELAALKTYWQQVYIQACATSIFQTFSWIDSFLSHMKRKESLLIFLFEKGSVPVGIAPLCIFKREKFFLNKIKYTEYGWSNYFDFIFLKGFESLCIDAFLQVLYEDFKKKWTVLELYPVSLQSKNIKLLLAAMNNKGTKYTIKHQNSSPYLPIDGEWGFFFKTLRGTKFRRNLKALKRKLYESGNIQVKFSTDFLKNIQVLKEMFGHALIVDSNSWQAEVKSGTYISQQSSAAFLSEVILKEPDKVLLSILYSNDEPISFYLCFIDGRKIVAYKKGFSKKIKKSGVGRIHESLLLEYLFEQKYDECDFMGLTGGHEDEGKLYWSDKTRELHNLYIYNQSNIIGKLLYLYHQCKALK